MPRNGLLIQYDWCTGCHACEVACKQEHNFSEGMVGIKVDEIVSTDSNKVYVDFMPYLTRFCDLCVDRIKAGEKPACVKHCQAICITYGTIAELSKALNKQSKSSIFVP